MKHLLFVLTSLITLLGCNTLTIEKKSLLVAVLPETEEVSAYYTFEGISLRDKDKWAQSDLDALRLAKFQFFDAGDALKLCEFDELRFFLDPSRKRQLCADRRMNIRNRSEFAKIVNDAINQAGQSISEDDEATIENKISYAHAELVKFRPLIKHMDAPLAAYLFAEGVCEILQDFDPESIGQLRDAAQADFQWLRFESGSVQLVLPATETCAKRISENPRSVDWLKRLRANIDPIELSQSDDGLVIELGSNGRIIHLHFNDVSRYAAAGEKKVVQLAGSPEPITVDGKAESVSNLIDKFIYSKTGFRLWTHVTGRFTVRARFDRMIGNKALLFKEDGGKVYIASDQLAVADRAFLNMPAN